MRDATLTAVGALVAGAELEADDFIQYGRRPRAQHRRLAADHVRRRRRARPDRAHRWTISRLRGGAPGADRHTDAASQRQNDVYGAVLGLALPPHQAVRAQLAAAVARVIEAQADRPPPSGARPTTAFWEARGEPRHYVSSKLMCWVAMDRAARLAARRGRESLADRWREVANEIHADICERGVDERGVFVQHYDTVALDGSNLLIPLVRFPAGGGPPRARDRARDRGRADRTGARPSLSPRPGPTTGSPALTRARS